MLRDHLLCGLQDDNLRQRLFGEQHLTFTKTFDMAVRAENAKDYKTKIKAEFSEASKTSTRRPLPPLKKRLKLARHVTDAKIRAILRGATSEVQGTGFAQKK